MPNDNQDPITAPCSVVCAKFAHTSSSISSSSLKIFRICLPITVLSLPKRAAHLYLTKPNCFIFQTYPKLNLLILRLIYLYVSFHDLIKLRYQLIKFSGAGTVANFTTVDSFSNYPSLRNCIILKIDITTNIPVVRLIYFNVSYHITMELHKITGQLFH